MTVRFPLLSAAVIVTVSLVLLPTVAHAQGAGAQAEPPRTPWGAPDLNGVWDFRTLTPFERPDDLSDQAFFTEEEAAQYEADRLAAFAVRDDQEPADIVGNYNQFWFDPGDSVSATNQTSLVVDPANGRVPSLTPEADQQDIDVLLAHAPLTPPLTDVYELCIGTDTIQ